MLPVRERPYTEETATMQAVEEIYCTLSEITEKLKARYRTVYRWVQAGTSRIQAQGSTELRTET